MRRNEGNTLRGEDAVSYAERSSVPLRVSDVVGVSPRTFRRMLDQASPADREMLMASVELVVPAG